jgi:hypothetical protein
MSTGLECEFFRTPANQWLYALQDWDCPVQHFDWREYATCYGPFASEMDAVEHLGATHANPGGYHVERNAKNAEPDETWARLIRLALQPYDDASRHARAPRINVQWN